MKEPVVYFTTFPRRHHERPVPRTHATPSLCPQLQLIWKRQRTQAPLDRDRLCRQPETCIVSMPINEILHWSPAGMGRTRLLALFSPDLMEARAAQRPCGLVGGWNVNQQQFSRS